MHENNPFPESLSVSYLPVGQLKQNRRTARTHSKRQVERIAASIGSFGFLVPILIDENEMVLAGDARLQAGVLRGMTKIPVIRATGLSEPQKRAFLLADNRLAESAGWDRDKLATEFAELAPLLLPLGLDLTITGFEPPEIDMILHDLDQPRPDPGDQLPTVPKQATSQRGELWHLGKHKLLCGDARSADDADRLMDGQLARLTFTDPPYNVRIAGHVQGKGKVRHAEFAFASGEMTEAAFTRFLDESLANIVRVSTDGAIIFFCMDWRHTTEVSAAARAVGLRQLNLVVWNKTSPGQGSFYRSQHELIFVFKVGEASPINTFGLGKTGRMRSNVWVYPGGNSFHAGRAEELAMHPTVKPIALVADALRDCSMKGDRVLDLFGGAGTTLMAAEKLGRVAHLMEYEPAYVDVTIQRWQRYTKLEAIRDGDGKSWREVAENRRRERESAPPGASRGLAEGDPAGLASGRQASLAANTKSGCF